jgi:hypothetical protein
MFLRSPGSLQIAKKNQRNNVKKIFLNDEFAPPDRILFNFYGIQ